MTTDSKRIVVVLTEAEIIAVDSAIITEIDRLSDQVVGSEPDSPDVLRVARIVGALDAAQIALQEGSPITKEAPTR
jgi:hypothetical protein